MNKPGGGARLKMPVTEHLRELRTSILWSLAAVGVAAVGVFTQADWFIHLLSRPIPRLVFIGPHEALVARVKIALFGGLILAMPVVLFQIWSFVSPGLSDRERGALKVAGPFSILLFFTGVAFAGLVAVPVTLRFLLGFGGSALEPMISVERLVAFIGMMLLAFGAIFELPVVIVFLSRIGIVTPAFLKQKRPVVVVSIFILAALLTPPDIVTQCLVAVPMLLLYELSILLSYWFKPHERI